MSDFRRDLGAGIAQYLASKGLAQWDWEGAAPYALDVDEWPTFLGPQLPPRPDRCVIVTVGTIVRRPRGDVDVPVQLRVRGLPESPDAPGESAAEVAELVQALGDLFQPHGMPLVHTLLGVVPISAVMPGGQADLGADDARRPGGTVNVTVRTRRVIGGDPKPRVILNRVYLTRAQYARLEDAGTIDPDTVYSLTD